MRALSLRQAANNRQRLYISATATAAQRNKTLFLNSSFISSQTLFLHNQQQEYSHYSSSSSLFSSSSTSLSSPLLSLPKSRHSASKSLSTLLIPSSSSPPPIHYEDTVLSASATLTDDNDNYNGNNYNNDVDLQHEENEYDAVVQVVENECQPSLHSTATFNGTTTTPSIHYLTHEHDLINGNVQGVVVVRSSSSSWPYYGNDRNSNMLQSTNNDIDVEKTFQDLSNQQSELLAHLEDLKNKFSHDSNNNKSDDDDDKNNKHNNNKTKSSSSSLQEKEYLMKLWKIANKMDMQLHHHYQTNAISIQKSNMDDINNNEDRPTSLDHFNKVIEAWKNVIDAYNNCIHDTNYHSLPVGIPQRATRLLDTMEKLQALSSKSSNGLTVDTYNNVLEIWSSSREHNLDTSAEMIFRRIEVDKIDGKHSMVDRYAYGLNGSSNSGDTTSTNNIQPNPETMKIMLRAWCKLQDQDERSYTTGTDTATNNLQLSIDTRADGGTGTGVSSIIRNRKANNNAKRRKGSSVFNASWYLIQMQGLLESGRSEFEPSLDDYNKIFKAWSEVKDLKNAARRSLSIMKKWESLYSNRLTQTKPNTECYKYLIQAISNSRTKHFAAGGNVVNQILSTMVTDGLVPDSACYSYAIRTWVKKARNNNIEPKERFEYAKQAQLVLKDMDEMYFRSGSVEIRPTTHDYNSVITALANCAVPGAAERAEELLIKMEKKYHDGDVVLMPDAHTYISTIIGWKYCPHVKKRIDGAKRVFERMKKQFSNGNHACKPTTESYHAIMNICRSYPHQNASGEMKRKALMCSIETINEMRQSNNVQLNSKTYNMILSAVGTLLDDGSHAQNKAIESVFTKCCQEGLVDSNVLNRLRRVATHDVYRRCVLEHVTKEGNANVLMLPMAWSRNTTRERPTIPLSFNSDYINQKNYILKEQKMRRLRSRRNQHLLQGGRAK